MTEDEIIKHFSDERVRHFKRMRMIRYQGYFMQALIIAVFLFFTFAPLFL